MLCLKIVHHFLHVQQMNDVFVDKANRIYSTMPTCNLIELAIIIQAVYGSLKEMKLLIKMLI